MSQHGSRYASPMRHLASPQPPLPQPQQQSQQQLLKTNGSAVADVVDRYSPPTFHNRTQPQHGGDSIAGLGVRASPVRMQSSTTDHYAATNIGHYNHDNGEDDEDEEDDDDDDVVVEDLETSDDDDNDDGGGGADESSSIATSNTNRSSNPLRSFAQSLHETRVKLNNSMSSKKKKTRKRKGTTPTASTRKTNADDTTRILSHAWDTSLASTDSRRSSFALSVDSVRGKRDWNDSVCHLFLFARELWRRDEKVSILCF